MDCAPKSPFAIPVRCFLGFCIFMIAANYGNTQIINEFLTSNSSGIADEDEDTSDWIEIYNPREVAIDLNGYWLTDEAENPRKWVFPAVSIPAKGYLTVFASAKDRAAPEGELHTNFKLGSDGDFLALFAPDGETALSIFSPSYPSQRSDISYGLGIPSGSVTLIAEGERAKWLVPEGHISDWNSASFDDSSWPSAKTGIGYGYPEEISEDGDIKSAMQLKNATVYVRLPFEIVDPDSVTELTLRMKYEDGFVAFLNGNEVARANAPDDLQWDSEATKSNPDSKATVFEDFAVALGNNLIAGQNILAIQGLNTSRGGSDILILPELLAKVKTGEPQIGYLLEPSPGSANGASLEKLPNDPQFSDTRGYFHDRFSLTLSADQPEAVIRYTLDGEKPDDSTGTVYTSPIEITETSVVRAVSVIGETASSVVTHTFLRIDDIVEQKDLHGSRTRRISESEEYGPLLKDSLLAQPAVCVSMDRSKPTQSEMEASIELLDPNQEEDGFQVDCGIKVVGGHSVGSPKNNFRLYFRGEYGDSELRYPLFKGHPYSDGATDRFQRLQLRSGSHDTFFWLGNTANPPSGGRKSDATYLRNRWINDMQFIMGHESSHGRFVQLFINGVYHGHYQIMEFPNDDFHASYLGGEAEDYHFTNGANSSKTGSDHGNGDTWRNNWSDIKSRARSSYAEVAEAVDLENLTDYMLLSFYAGNTWDWNPQQNWMAGGPKTPGAGGWKFYGWDSDIIFQDVNGNNLSKNVPDGLFRTLIDEHEEFRMLVRDRIYKHFFNDGALTPESVRQVFDYRANEIFLSIVAETARWQPNSPARSPWDRNDEWQAEWDHYKEVYFPQRTDIVLDQFRKTRVAGHRLYPIETPEFTNNVSEPVDAGFSPKLEVDRGTIYYTVDGSDPRLPDGGISPSAIPYAGGSVPFSIIEPGANWNYLDDGSDQGTAWRAINFDDSSWKNGAAQFGYGESDQATEISYGESPSKKHVTTWFRHAFTVTDAAAVTELKVEVLRDDGAVIYLNGQEVARDNMPEEGAIAWDTLARSAAGGSEEREFYPFDVDPELLVEGKNVLAIEIHQNSTGSSDMSFDCALSGKVLSAADTVKVTENTLLRMRALDDDTWSAINEAFITVKGTQPASHENIVVTEVHYNPASDEAPEFVEVHNHSESTVDLSGMEFSNGIRFTFPNGFTLEPGGYCVVVGDLTDFAATYQDNSKAWFFPNIQVAGEFEGNLRNGGEALGILTASGAQLLEFEWGDSGAWPGRADGSGSSLELRIPDEFPTASEELDALLSSPGSWRSSSEYQGSPGRGGLGPDNRIVVNEVRAQAIAPDLDTIELYNTEAESLDISGWYLSDSLTNLTKYRFPSGSVLASGSYLALDANAFSSQENENALVPFGLSGTKGDNVVLVEADQNGSPLRFVDRVDFPPMAPGTSYGRWPNASGSLYPLVKTTLGSNNAAETNSVYVGPAVVSSVHYNPDGMDDGLEFVTIANSSSAPVPLAGWRLRGEVDFNFTDEFILASGASITLVGFDPGESAKAQAFREAFGIDQSITLLGPWFNGNNNSAKLNDGGGRLTLLRPGEVVNDGDDTYTPYYVEDEVNYDDTPDWPQAADGMGMALRRRMLSHYGDDPSNWEAVAPFGDPPVNTPLEGFEDWASAVFAGMPNVDTSPGGNPDGDALSNTLEFFFALNPLSPDESEPLQAALTESGGILLRFNSQAGVVHPFRIEASSDLIQWSALSQTAISSSNVTESEDGKLRHHQYAVDPTKLDSAILGYFRIVVGTQ